MDEQTQKQQVSEILRQANSLVVTTSKSPGLDEIAAVLALTQMLEKMGKRVEAIISTAIPAELNFLATNLLHKEYKGVRDFVIELDTSKAEADKLKYIPEEGRLKIIITPFNGNFNKDDLGYSYGDFHCDAVVAVGAESAQDLDPAIAHQRQLLSKIRLVAINTNGNPAGGSDRVAWIEPQASSISEMLMSLSEALQPGLLDNQIATSLLTGIVAATNHFTGPGTTPKVMTMAAQLMAAGADQATVVKNLGQEPPSHAQIPDKTKDHAPKSDNELAPAVEKDLAHHEHKQKSDHSKHDAPDKQSPKPDQSNQYHPTKPTPLAVPPPQPVFQPPAPAPNPPEPDPVPPAPIEPTLQAIKPPFDSAQTKPLPAPSSPPVQPGPPTMPTGRQATPHLDIEAARRAVAEATQQMPTPPSLPTQQVSSSIPPVVPPPPTATGT